MSNTNSSEDNMESPSTYASKAYREYRKKEKSKDTSSRVRRNSVDGRELEEGTNLSVLIVDTVTQYLKQ